MANWDYGKSSNTLVYLGVALAVVVGLVVSGIYILLF